MNQHKKYAMKNYSRNCLRKHKLLPPLVARQLSAAGLAETHLVEVHLRVFAPTTKAFSEILPAGTVESTLKH